VGYIIQQHTCMPKKDIDYTNTVIYKITCLDKKVDYVYVGHTSNFRQRKHTHKQHSLNMPKSCNRKLYEIINDHGGWENWFMELLGVYTFKDQREAKMKEQEYFLALNNRTALSCELEVDHKNETDCIDSDEEVVNDLGDNVAFAEADTMLRVHNDKKFDLNELILEIVKSNADLQKQCLEMQKQFMDVCKSNTTTTITQSSNNSHNKTFNMQVFLNEHCKDAMNLKDFVESIDLNLDDLELVGKKGFVDGISNIIICKLKDTEVHLRPIHCSDAKREVMYIKENNKWAKEGPKNENMRKFVQFIERKNIKLLGEYQEKYPDSRDIESPRNDHYVQLSLNATCATEEHLDKVISRIAKEVFIDKL
jgi:hypothetical protein